MIIEKESVLGKIWHKINVNEDLASQIKIHLNISDLLSTLIARNSRNLQDAEGIFYPKIKTLLPDPFHLRDMQKKYQDLNLPDNTGRYYRSSILSSISKMLNTAESFLSQFKNN